VPVVNGALRVQLRHAVNSGSRDRQILIMTAASGSNVIYCMLAIWAGAGCDACGTSRAPFAPFPRKHTQGLSVFRRFTAKRSVFLLGFMARCASQTESLLCQETFYICSCSVEVKMYFVGNKLVSRYFFFALMEGLKRLL
jgi:hypothetical protein